MLQCFVQKAGAGVGVGNGVETRPDFKGAIHARKTHKSEDNFINVHQIISYNDSQLVSNTCGMSVSSGFCIP